MEIEQEFWLIAQLRKILNNSYEQARVIQAALRFAGALKGDPAALEKALADQIDGIVELRRNIEERETQIRQYVEACVERRKCKRKNADVTRRPS